MRLLRPDLDDEEMQRLPRRPLLCLRKHRFDHKPQCLLIQEEKAKKEAKAHKRAEVLEGLGVELYDASFDGKEARVGQRLKLGIDVNFVVTKEGGAKGAFPLIAAAQEGKVEVVRLLLAVEGVSINQAITIGGGFPLYIACQNNHVEAARLLLAAQAQVDQVVHEGWSVCHKAALEGHVQVLEMLLEAGADVQLKSDDGLTALDMAIVYKQPVAEAVIRKHLTKAKLEAKANAEPKAKAGVEEESK